MSPSPDREARAVFFADDGLLGGNKDGGPSR